MTWWFCDNGDFFSAGRAFIARSLFSFLFCASRMKKTYASVHVILQHDEAYVDARNRCSKTPVPVSCLHGCESLLGGILILLEPSRDNRANENVIRGFPRV